jgi:hypothetical protein
MSTTHHLQRGSSRTASDDADDPPSGFTLSLKARPPRPTRTRSN